MSVKPPKAEVSLSRFDFRYVPLPEVAMPAEEPSIASTTVVSGMASANFLAHDFFATMRAKIGN